MRLLLVKLNAASKLHSVTPSAKSHIPKDVFVNGVHQVGVCCPALSAGIEGPTFEVPHGRSGLREGWLRVLGSAYYAVSYFQFRSSHVGVEW